MAARLVAQCTWSSAKAWKENVTLLPDLSSASVVQQEEYIRLKANRRHIQKATGTRARLARWSVQSRAGYTVQAGKECH